ncbi:MAG: methylmalonyl Co-A mutase-associated GTPase MeaB [Candidatus Baldrarchaeia archaeon]
MRYNVEELVQKLIQGDKFATARLISLAENDPTTAQKIISLIYPYTGRAHVIGVTGPPGSGKSTLVYRLAKEWRKRGKTVGIVAVDPTSPFTGGALLGDRIRMQELTCDDGVFIRSMATRGSLGGLARATKDVVRILDASGKDVIVVETVGAGQSEVAIVRIAHTILVVLCPGLGDEIQVLKAGIMEIGDVFVVNKADREGADETAMQIEDMLNMASTIRFNETGWIPPVVKTSAIYNRGISELIDRIEEHWRFLKKMDKDIYFRRRVEQDVIEALRSKIEQMALNHVMKNEKYNELIEKVANKEIDPYTAADIILNGVIRSEEKEPEENE